MSDPSWQAPSVKKTDNYNYGNGNAAYGGGQQQQQQQYQQPVFQSYSQKHQPEAQQYGQPNYSNTNNNGGAYYYSAGTPQPPDVYNTVNIHVNNNNNNGNGNGGGEDTRAAHPDWYYGICGCCGETAACCEAWWCFYCLVSRTRNMLEHNLPEIDWCCCLFLCCCDEVLCMIPSCVCQMTNRERVRGRYHIPGSGCEDCCCAYCCPCCLSAQLLLEMSTRGDCPGACCCQDSLPAGNKGKQYLAMA